MSFSLFFRGSRNGLATLLLSTLSVVSTSALAAPSPEESSAATAPAVALSTQAPIQRLGGSMPSDGWAPTLPHPHLSDAEGQYPASAWKRTAFAVSNAGSELKQRTVHTATDGSWDLYVPFYSYHPAWVYSQEARDRFHDDAWGLGVGKHWTDSRGNQDLVYGMVFTESHGHAEPIVGYARIWNTDPLWGQLKLGWGYTVGVTSRPDILSGVPFPLALPLLSAQMGRFSVMSAIVPDTKGLRVALFWARIEVGRGAL